jgi:hypothetical protein
MKKMAGGVAQVVEQLSSKHEAISSNPSNGQKKKKSQRICYIREIRNIKVNETCMKI